MRATKRIYKTEKEIRKVCEKQVTEYLTKNYQKISRDGAFQMLAVAFVVLIKEFGFGTKRLKRLKDLIENEFMLMEKGICGRQYNTDDCKRHLKENYSIDFEESCYEAKGWNEDECKNK